MGYDQDKLLIDNIFDAVNEGHFWTSMQLVMLAGKTLETIAINQARQSIEGSHSQTVRLLEGVDSSFRRMSKSGDASLRFPFDVMDYATRTMSDNWCNLMGMETTNEAKLTEQLEEQKRLSSQSEKRFETKITVLTQGIKVKEKELVNQQTEFEKVKKAKLSAQRSQRKIKAELEANNRELLEVKAENDAVIEKYERQLSENELLQQQKQQLELELAKAKQDAQKHKVDSGQMASQLEALTTEQAKSIAEKDGLHKRIEELQRQLEQPSHYTE